MIPIKYIGHRPVYRDGACGSELTFEQGQTLLVADEFALKMLRHPSVYERGDVAAAAGMSAAKAHRYLVSFQRLGLVTQDPRTARYDLGPAALKLGLASLARLDAMRLARERVPGWMEQIGHTLALAVWGNHGPTIVHWEESPQAVTANLRLGDVMPLLSSATGRCFAAYMPPEAVAPLLQQELAQAAKLRRTDLPATLEQLRTFNYLLDVPVDPYTGAPLQYNLARGLLWSVGNDLKSSNGLPTELPLNDATEPTLEIGIAVAAAVK